MHRARRRLSTACLNASVAGLVLGIAMAGPAQAQSSARSNPWGATVTDVTPDPAIRLGKLPNGMKYAIMRNDQPKGAASVRLHFNFGSLGEADNERGLAHFIEHMAFNGSKNVPEGEMVKILERQGLKFGPDTNAVTGFDITMYMLDLPKADKERLDTAFMLMREVASNVSFDPAAVDRERGVLLGERRFRDTFQLHAAQDQIGFLLPKTNMANRFPIGTPEVIQTAPAERIRALYNRYYRPENATFVFVGDADPATIEQRIRKTFGDWKGVGEAGPPIPRGTIDPKRPSAFDTFVDPAVPNQITIQSLRPWADPADSRADRRNEMVKNLANAMFTRRLQRIVNAPDSILLAGFGGESGTDQVALGAQVIGVAKDGAWTEGLGIVEQELRRAIQHGFVQSELDLQRTDTLGKLKTAAAQANSRTNPALAEAIVGVIGQDDLVTSPQWRLAFFEQESGKVGLDEVNRAFREMWSGSGPLVHVTSKTAVADTAVAAAFAKSRQAAVAPPADEAAIEFAYDNWGKAGTIAADTRIADLGVRTVRFANNVKLNIKTTDFEPGKVAYNIRMAGGNRELPKDKPGATVMMSVMSALAATSKHSVEDLKTLTAGRQVKLGFAAGPDAYVVDGAVPADDLALQMKVSAAYLTDPGFRPEADAQWKNLSSVLLKQFTSQPKTVLDTRLTNLLAMGDGRFGLPGGDAIAQRSFADVRPMLTAAAANAPIEITIVGDVTEQAAIAAVAESFGALPTRQMTETVDPALNRVGFLPASEAIELTHTGDADQALVASVWRTDDDSDYRRYVGLSVLSEVLDLLLTESVREQLGASYGVSSQNTASGVYDDFGYVTVNSVVSPTGIKDVETAIAEAAASLRDKPVDADLLARAKNPILESISKDMRKNSYWLAYLDEAQTRPDRLDRLRQREAMVKAITPAEIQALARQYLTETNRISVRIKSDQSPAPAAGSTKASPVERGR